MKLRIAVLEDLLEDITQISKALNNFHSECDFILVYIGKDNEGDSNLVKRHLKASFGKEDYIQPLNIFKEIKTFILSRNPTNEEAQAIIKNICEYFLQEQFHVRFFDHLLIPFTNINIPNSEVDWGGAHILAKILSLEKQNNKIIAESHTYSNASVDSQALLNAVYGDLDFALDDDESLLGYLKSHTNRIEKNSEKFSKWLSTKIEMIIIGNTSLLEIYNKIWAPGSFGLHQVTHNLTDDKLDDLRKRIGKAREDCKSIEIALDHNSYKDSNLSIERKENQIEEINNYLGDLESSLEIENIPGTKISDLENRPESFKKKYRFCQDPYQGIVFLDMIKSYIDKYAPVDFKPSIKCKKTPVFYCYIPDIQLAFKSLFLSIFTNAECTKLDLDGEYKDNVFILTIRDNTQMTSSRKNLFEVGGKMKIAKVYFRGYCDWSIKADFKNDGSYLHFVYGTKEDEEISSFTGVEHTFTFSLPTKK